MVTSAIFGALVRFEELEGLIIDDLVESAHD